ncbi:hypothetical protein EWM64_g9352 [Hericium alpestre]|uniref:Autophagy-related protein 4 n=1 Tax=Hericium alpestre TaxID=135208 RepID=A0A4Y9ZKE5_9AGAM|nr:hypothetical protein EWM64_g9352 [Hericium alpestre]
MSSKARHSPSASSPSHGSKLPKFLQSKQTRDRSKSMIDPASGGSVSSSSSSPISNPLSESLSESSSSSQATPMHKNHNHINRPLARRGSKLSGVREERRQSSSSQPPTQDADISEDYSMADEGNTSMDEPPVIIEPVTPHSPRPRTRSERPLSSMSDNLPNRLSGWFHHTFNTSSSDLTLPSLLSSSHVPSSPSATNSPKGKGSALLTAAKHGKGHLDKAMRYLLDSDATPDKCSDPIWLLGVMHPGYEPPPPVQPGTPARRTSSESHRSPSFRSTTSSTVTGPHYVDPSLSQSLPPSTKDGKNPAANWPPVFYADFTSRIWVTYRSHFQPIRDSSLSMLENEQAEAANGNVNAVSSSPQSRRWNWPSTGEKGWTSDAGWGCMLRTGQSLLANALLHLHLGRDWRRPPQPLYTSDYATYVQILTWFFDSPLPYSPFSVHRMALAGKDLGKDVGQWFGPSTAAGAIKTLVHAFPDAGLGVAVAVDSQIFQTDVYSASHPPIDATTSPKRGRTSTWGGRAVLILIGIRLGLDGVNPIYYDTIKTLYTFPQSVGIAGGRPSSSYYFVGSQSDNLFYLDPHHARPAIPLRPPPSSFGTDTLLYGSRDRHERQTTPESDKEQPRLRQMHTPPSNNHHRSPTSPSSVRTASSTFSYHAPLSPSPLAQQLSSSSSSSTNSQPNSTAHTRWQSSNVPSAAGSVSAGNRSVTDFSSSEMRSGHGLDPLQEHYVSAYRSEELRTFHCDRVRKMPLSGLDPSMLIGFLCKDEADWKDLRRRVADLSKNHKTIFSIQDEPPSWPSDSDDNMGLESMSEPDMDIDMPDDDDDADGDVGGDFFDASEGRDRSPSASPSPDIDASSARDGAKSVDTEDSEDPVGPITPGPRSTFESERGVPKGAEDFAEGEGDEGLDDDEEWVDPALPTPVSQPQPSEGSTGNGKAPRRSKKGAADVPLVKTPTPGAQQHFPFPSSQAEGPEEKKRVPQMSNARARDGGRTQSGGVKGVVTNEDGDDF